MPGRSTFPGYSSRWACSAACLVGFGIIAEWRMGVLERMRVTPISRLALLLGRVMRDAIVLLLQSIILVVAGFILGLRVPIVGVFIGLSFVLLLAVSAAALRIRPAWRPRTKAFMRRS